MHDLLNGHDGLLNACLKVVTKSGSTSTTYDRSSGPNCGRKSCTTHIRKETMKVLTYDNLCMPVKILLLKNVIL